VGLKKQTNKTNKQKKTNSNDLRRNGNLLNPTKSNKMREKSTQSLREACGLLCSELSWS